MPFLAYKGTVSGSQCLAVPGNGCEGRGLGPGKTNAMNWVGLTDIHLSGQVKLAASFSLR